MFSVSQNVGLKITKKAEKDVFYYIAIKQGFKNCKLRFKLNQTSKRNKNNSRKPVWRVLI